jgi:pilus assembly protein Flp/PilA
MRHGTCAFFSRDFISSDEGTTAIEYTMIAAGIAVAIVTAINALGGGVSGLFTEIETAVQ